MNFDPRSVRPRVGTCVLEILTRKNGAGHPVGAWEPPRSGEIHLPGRLFAGRVVAGHWKRGGITVGALVLVKAHACEDLGGWHVSVEWPGIVGVIPELPTTGGRRRKSSTQPVARAVETVQRC